jgi:hypothetical protein
MNTYCKAALLVLAAGMAYGQPAVPAAQVRFNNLNTAYNKLAPNNKTVICGPTNVSPSATDDTANYCRQLQAVMAPGSRRVEFAALVDVQGTSVAKQAFNSALSSYAGSRLDVQNSAPPGSPGSTSAAERAGISSVLGAALDAGAVTQSVSGSTLTLQANALSLARFLEGQKDIFLYCSDGTMGCNGQHGWAPFLNKISGSAALSVSNSSQAVSGTVMGAPSMSTTQTSTTQSATALIQNSSSRLSSFTVKAQLYNNLDLHSAIYQQYWKKAFQASIPGASAVVAASDAAFGWLQNDIYKTWFAAAEPMVRDAIEQGADAVETAVATQWGNLVAAEGNSIPNDQIAQFYQTAGVYLTARDAANDSIRQQLANGVSVSYTFSQPQSQPKISTLKLIYTLHPGVLKKDQSSSSTAQSGGAPGAAAASSATPAAKRNDYAVSFNFGADLYDSPPSGTHTLKDLQGALQLDYHFGKTTTSAVGTLAGYYQYQSSASAIMIGSGNLAPGTDIMLPGTAATLLAPKGHIWVVEGLLTFATKAGNIPVGVTWSNRTELINAQEVRGHVGFNFDFSTLFAGSQSTK